MLELQLKWQRGEFMLEIELKLPAAQVVLLSGPSGGGKTTLLRLIAGLEKPEAGKIQWKGEVWSDHKTASWLRPQERNMSLVFQAYALFPHWNVKDNLAFAQKEKPDQGLLKTLIDICDLQPLLEHYPAQLSGGQQQRVALARSLLRKSSVILLDEPFSAQDMAGRERLIQYMKEYQQAYQSLILLSSHDHRGIDQWADQHIVMLNGQLIEGPTDPVLLEAIYLGMKKIDGQNMAQLDMQGRVFWWPDPPKEWKDLPRGTKVLL